MKHCKYENNKLQIENEKKVIKQTYITDYYDDDFIVSMIESEMYGVMYQTLTCEKCCLLHKFRGINAGDSSYTMKKCEGCNEEIGKVRDDVYDGDLLKTETF